MQKIMDIKKIAQRIKVHSEMIVSFICKLSERLHPLYKKIQTKFFATKEQTVKFSLPLLIIFLGFYSCIFSQKIINKNLDEIFTISDQIRQYYADRPDYWGLSTSEVVQKKIIADTFLNNDKIIISGNKEIFIGQGKEAEIVMPRSSSFDIILPKLTKAQCMAYAEKKLSSDNEVKLVSIQIINQTNETSFEWGREPSLPIKKYASKDLCSDNDNILIWTVK